MVSTQALTNIRTALYAAAGLVCVGYALLALSGTYLDLLPHWLPLTAGALAAVGFFATAILAGTANTAASLDEGYHNDRRIAGNAGFWTAIVTGTGLWLTAWGGDLQLAITMTLAAGVYLLAHVVLELRGR